MYFQFQWVNSDDDPPSNGLKARKLTFQEHKNSRILKSPLRIHPDTLFRSYRRYARKSEIKFSYVRGKVVSFCDFENPNWTIWKTRLKRFNETTISEIADDGIIYHNVVKRRLSHFDIVTFDYTMEYFRPGKKNCGFVIFQNLILSGDLQNK